MATPAAPEPDSDLERLEELATRLAAEPAAFAGAGELAAAAGWGASKLLRLARLAFHATPAELLVRARVGHARRLLLETRRRLPDLAFEVGFESPSAFHETFLAATGMTPEAYRGLRSGDRFLLRLPEGFRTADTLAFLGRDPQSPTERVAGRTAVRALSLDGVPARLHVELADGHAACRLEAARTLSPAARAAAHRTACRWLGLTTDPAPFESRARRRRDGRRLVAARPGLRIPQAPSVFEALVWAVCGQQVNLAFARTLRRRLIELASPAAADGLAVHPGPAEVARLDPADLVERQFSRRKAEYLVAAAARAAGGGGLDLEAMPERPAPRAERELAALAGVGPWTAAYVLMRGCAFADCVPVGDSGLVRALRTFYDLAERPGPAETLRRMAPFAPFRSLATFHLWSTLGDPA